ncbi:MAG: methyltransferase [Verrucomicrobiota bacterium]
MSVDPTPPYPPCNDNLLWDINMSFIHFPTLLVADELGLFALLDGEPLTRDEVGARLSIGPRANSAMLGVLASLGLLRDRGGRYYLSDVAKTYLLPDSPYYWGDMMALNRTIMMGAEPLKKAMLLDETNTFTGKPDDASLVEAWEKGEVDPALARQFTKAMDNLFQGPAQHLARTIDLAPVTRLLDVGGGSGCFSIALAQHHPELRATILDLPAVCDVTREFIAKRGVADRVDARLGDMFSRDWPGGYDGVFFGSVFHDWTEEQCRFLAKRSFEALPSGGRIFLHEVLHDDTGNGPLMTAGFSMFMVYNMQGQQYTAAQLQSFLGDAGFTDCQIATTTGYHFVVSARKP